jgi:hypothetical protein
LGDDQLRAVRVAPIGADGGIADDRARLIDTDILVTGFGLATSAELYHILGCRLDHHPHRGGWLPQRDADLETSRPCIFAAGDGAGIGGVELAILEGGIAGLAAARRLGLPLTTVQQRREARHRERLARMMRFREGLEALYRPTVDFLRLITPQTLICRCEEVTAAMLTSAGGSAFALKGVTRIGMGRCQGRFCQSTLGALIAARDGCPVEAVSLPRLRPPARPVRIGDLLAENVPEAVLPADPHLPRGERIG